jgi:hypothetical protein
MGLGNAFLQDLLALKRDGQLNGVKRVAEMGDQQINDTLMTAPELPELYRLFGGAMPALTPVGAPTLKQGSPSSKIFWTSLGIERTAFDLIGDAVRLDLNRGRVPWRLRSRFDLVVNTGTTEHVANQANAFAVIHDLCSVGGIMYHELPAGGMIDHGLVSYEPKFFRFLAGWNGYEELFIRYYTHGKATTPPDLDSSWIKDEISVCVLRVALRKRRNTRFRVPMDTAYTPLLRRIAKAVRRRLAAH